MVKGQSEIPGAPKAIGPYSHAVTAGNFIFISGQIPIDPATGNFVPGGIKEQTEQVLKNLKAILTHCDLTFGDVAKATIFLTDLAHFQTVNEIYEKALAGAKPARATVQVAALPKGALVEIDMTAFRG